MNKKEMNSHSICRHYCGSWDYNCCDFTSEKRKWTSMNLLTVLKRAQEEVLGEDVRKVSKTELAATLTYGDQNDKDNNIYYRILKTTFYEGGPEEITGLHTEALGVLFPVDSMDSCEEMMIQDWPGALYKKDDTAFSLLDLFSGSHLCSGIHSKQN